MFIRLQENKRFRRDLCQPYHPSEGQTWRTNIHSANRPLPSNLRTWIIRAGRSGYPSPANNSVEVLESVKNHRPQSQLNKTQHRFNMDAQHPTEATHTPTTDKLVVTLPEDLLATLRTTCAEKANVSLLGRIQGKHPGIKALTAWARDNLHHSLNFISPKANNLFEISFSSPEGRIHALTQIEQVCEFANITFSSWRPHFDASARQGQTQLDYPIWLQIVDLCQILKEESFLRTIGGHIGQVIAVDNSEAYRAKLFGPRIRILVRDLDNLPKIVVLPRLDEEGVVEYNLEYNGLPHQCGRCRSRDHQVRQCSRRETKFQRHDHQIRHTFSNQHLATQLPSKEDT